jgi:hypothetical protein
MSEISTRDSNNRIGLPTIVFITSLIVKVSISLLDTTRSAGLLQMSESSRRKDLYPTTHNTHKRKTSIPQARFEPAVPASERPYLDPVGSSVVQQE